MISYGWFLVQNLIPNSIYCCCTTNSKSGHPTEKSMCARSNDIDHLQMRMINIFEWHGKTKKKNSISIATFSWWHENRLCWAHDAWRSTTTWNENINRMYASDNWNEEKRQPRSIALLYGNAHFDVFVPPIINGANIHSEPINMPTYRSLLFAPFHVWLFHAIGHFFFALFHPYRFL